MAFEQGTPDRVPPDQPNPVIVGPGLSALGEGAYRKASTATPAVVADGAVRDSTPSYFSDVPGKGATGTKDAYVNSSASPIHAASGASSGPALLRRLSLVGGAHLTPATPMSNAMADHPGLQLTGRIISAAFCIPYKVVHHPGADWVRASPRPFASTMLTNLLTCRSSNPGPVCPLCSTRLPISLLPSRSGSIFLSAGPGRWIRSRTNGLLCSPSRETAPVLRRCL